MSLVAYGPCDIYHGESACYVDEWYNERQYRKDPTAENLARWEGSKEKVAWYEKRLRALGGFKSDDVKILGVQHDGAIVVEGPLFDRPWISRVADGMFNGSLSLFYK